MILQHRRLTTLLGTELPLRKDIEANVPVAGAGAAGLSAAYLLMDKGLRVVIPERNICGGSSSGKSAGTKMQR